ncbi:hypothetical protein CLAFUW4_08841 [Fulvia fulva]|uniref:Uncharacterized protein n=1 Tax=Passalora fulva TaxID=5499 RepID=A0A9Q8PFV3_PASFU|nr:uncharacterized protein CLAFUR5_08947 [Fulvia fulva]KAK4613218.1 hypothetical protein CLAFUR4_08847 [Fulvia fulva]KAK4614878.1 hypothetical protein CLAFUR0_08839 [Fulvia fulva]UJO21726.1 hypothetical protein CLAFUR5_08947 [Fulvia fulva]WPV20679.1 hypothetical protein CLAFUW4_08841 [Fulvia fulva]WPV34908.1 hypothetical protein CLAFUW7_08842 [Fulvia fulva]
MAMPMRHDARDAGVFTRIGSGNLPTRNTRSWNQNGVNYTVETASWSSPGGALSFNAMTGNAGGPFQRSFTAPMRFNARSSGLFGTAFGLLEDVLSVQQQARQSAMHGAMGQGGTNRRRVHVDVESDTDDDLAYDTYGNGRARPKSMFSRLKDKLLDGKLRHEAREESDSRSREREQSPVRRPRMNQRRHSSFRTETREPEWAQQPRGRTQDRFVEVDYEDDDEPVYLNEQPIHEQPQNNRSVEVDGTLIEALENAVEIERRSVRNCKKCLEQATRQPAISAHHLQRMVDELKGHEDSLMNAQANLQEAQARQRSTRPRPTSYHPQTVPQEQPGQRQSAQNLADDFFPPFGASFGPTPQAAHSRPQHQDPLLRAFEEMHGFDPFSRTSPFGAFDHLFEQMHAQPSANNAHFHFFSNAGAAPQDNERNKRTRYSMPGGAPNFSQPYPGFTAYQAPPPPQPPANLLKPDEAKRLFKTYNDKWNGLTTTDTNIPYPARGLKANALGARDSIWAPLCSAPPSTWSNETVMKANAQAFYLGVVGLVPVYKETPGTGRIEISFDKSKANPAQMKVLMDMLKKEKTRWHSDRLGRRNGGVATGATNEVLQGDERARAVFHAACELMDCAQ